MEIQKKEKESLAAYIHRFKREANRCNFNNNAAIIQTFVKGLKNTHTLAAHVYEKGPQNLADAISRVEKLQAAQQLTTTLLPLSTVNVMSSEDDKCFQCQELGHMACHCRNIRCFNCDEYGHVAVDCPDRIPPSGTPACHKRHHSSTRHQTRLTSKHHHRDRHRLADLDHIHTLTDIEVTATITHTDIAPGLITDAHTEAHCIINTQVLIVTNVTHHIRGLPHIEVLLCIQETAIDLDHIRHTNLAEQHLLNPHPVLTKHH